MRALGGRGGSGVRRAAALVVAGLLVASTAGCDLSLFKKGRGRLFDYSTTGNVKIGTTRVPLLSFKGKDSGPTLDLLKIYAKKDASPSFGFLQVNHELWGSFQVDVSVGRFDERLDLPLSPAFACLELDGRDTSPLEYFGNCVQFSQSGAQVFAINRFSSNLGTMTFPGADRVDLRIEADGSNIWFMARPFQTGDFETFASTPFSGMPFPLLPSVGANFLPGGAGFTFGYPRITFNGDPPSPEDIEDEIADLMDDADEDLWCACDALFFGDDPTAIEYMEEALDHLEDALALTDELPDDKFTKGLRKFILKAGDGIDRTLDDLDREKPVIKLRKGLSKVQGFNGRVIDLIRPISIK